jgi:hypothetical protein
VFFEGKLLPPQMDHILWRVVGAHKISFLEAPVLASPDYTKDFFIFSIASDETIIVVLLQKNEEGHEKPIAFFNRSLRDAELKYDILEK